MLLADFLEANIQLRLLTGALEVQQRAAARKRIFDREMCPIPTRPLIIGVVGIARVAIIEAVRHGDFSPDKKIAFGLFRRAPGFPNAAQVPAIVFPTLQ
jgi:hypothetical protein